MTLDLLYDRFTCSGASVESYLVFNSLLACWRSCVGNCRNRWPGWNLCNVLVFYDQLLLQTSSWCYLPMYFVVGLHFWSYYMSFSTERSWLFSLWAFLDSVVPYTNECLLVIHWMSSRMFHQLSLPIYFCCVINISLKVNFSSQLALGHKRALMVDKEFGHCHGHFLIFAQKVIIKNRY
jgi:hypothetical protein